MNASRADPSSRSIIHLDLDAFYASVEQRDDPTLRGRPVIVGGHPTRGVVLAASYEVRPLGVRSAMPMVEALRRAPDAVVVRPRFRAYATASAAVFNCLQRVTPLFEPLSLDEAFLDVTASLRLFGSAEDIARDVRRRIAIEVGLPASAGVAAVKFVAKIASDLAKPNGQVAVPPGHEQTFLAPLPVGRLWGVGPKSERGLQALGLRTIGHLAAVEPAALITAVGPGGQRLWELAHGIDTRPVIPDREAKSIGAEDTFNQNVVGVAALGPWLHAQAGRVAWRLRRAGRACRIVQVKLKFADFTLRTRQATLPSPSDDGQTLYRAVATLVRAEPLPAPVRLTGVSAQSLVLVPSLVPSLVRPSADGSKLHAQLDLFGSAPERPAAQRATALNAALDAIAAKFGHKAVVTADLAASEVDPEDEEWNRLGG